jgi:L-2,4-diaminobutyrate transaminase
MTNTTDSALGAADRASVFHPMTDLRKFSAGAIAGPRIIARAEGVHIWDTQGRKFLDGFGGLYCVNVGYGRTEIADAIARQAHTLAYYHLYAGNSHESAIVLAQRLLQLAPAGMKKVFFGLSGSDANDTQVKIVWYINNVLGRPRKKKIISRHRAYHGATVMAGSLTGIPTFHRAFDLPLPRVLHTTAPHHYWEAAAGESELQFSARCARDLERLIVAEDPETIAAFIAEPMMGSGGIIPPPTGYWTAIQEVLHKYDVLLIADEVVCGFGRLGADFGCLRYGIKPDLITVAKGLTSAYAPLSAVIVGERAWSALERGSDEFGPFAHGYTYTGHPIGTAAAIANLAILERENLRQNAARVGSHVIAALREQLASHPLVGEVRGEGLLFAVELVADRAAKVRFDPALKVGAAASAACLERGLIARAMPGGDILGFAPPLTLTIAQADELVAITCAALQALPDTLRKAG